MDDFVSSIENPIKFFQSLLTYGNLEEMLSKFKEHSPFEYFDDKTFTALDFETNHDGEFERLEYKFEDYLATQLKKEALNSTILIDQFLRTDLETAISPVKINNLLDILYKLYQNNSQKFSESITNRIRKALLGLVKHIFSQYDVVGIKHPSRRLIKPKSKVDLASSFFGAVTENRRFYKELHAVFYNNEIIPEYDEDEDVFFQMLISNRPSEFGYILQLKDKVSVRDAAQIFKSLHPFFSNFNFPSIGSSGCFYSNKGTLLTEASLYTAYSDSIKYLKEHPTNHLKNSVQTTIDWINQQIPKYKTFQT